ncbi:phosphate signaling complex protein PhoU [Desulfovibrio litoralis]|uniref:Phosphate-specific transport system accessory protein PhoU n=1 Tax=Desulfovibrio litoralis DSM 11393 TaxID=1121455 RepID=A0A1M7SNV7_9BACT|nr:phosphate signaling complex protein PhoU [Desulfovibrio litoralis]SHN60207.1 phosphate transport system protein [Desulfovibrio litoralis DSM 11393]
MLSHETQTQQMISNLRTRLLVMFASTTIAFDEALDALHSGNVGKAIAVIEGDDTINSLEVEIDNLCLSLLVKAQPVAKDLRFVIGTLRIINDLERIGDEATIIAERILNIEDSSYKLVEETNKMLINLAQTILHKATNAFKDQDAESIFHICKLDDEISQAEMTVMQNIMTKTEKEAASFNSYTTMHSILVSRSLNRICRRAINIAEHTYFIYKGENLKHAHC